MAIFPPTFKDIRTTVPLMSNTDMKEYTKNAAIPLGKFLTSANWSNGAGTVSDQLEIAEQMDGSWRIRGSLQYVGISVIQGISNIFIQDDVPQLRGITFAKTEGQGFTISDGALGANVFNLYFGQQNPIGLDIGLLNASATDAMVPLSTIFTCDMTIYPVDS